MDSLPRPHSYNYDDDDVLPIATNINVPPSQPVDTHNDVEDTIEDDNEYEYYDDEEYVDPQTQTETQPDTQPPTDTNINPTPLASPGTPSQSNSTAAAPPMFSKQQQSLLGALTNGQLGHGLPNPESDDSPPPPISTGFTDDFGLGAMSAAPATSSPMINNSSEPSIDSPSAYIPPPPPKSPPPANSSNSQNIIKTTSPRSSVRSTSPLSRSPVSVNGKAPPPSAFGGFASPPTASPSSIGSRSVGIVRGRRSGLLAGPPKLHAGNVLTESKSLGAMEKTKDDEKDEDAAMASISFDSVLRQADVGVEMTDRLKEVVRKFCKHQQMGADKLQEIYAKLPSTYQDTDGMAAFADLCHLVHTLILETVSAQKRLSDFLAKDVVPAMDGYIKEKQQWIQALKHENRAAEMKVKNAVATMHKASAVAKQSAAKAKQLAVGNLGTSTANKKGKKGKGNNKMGAKMGMGSMLKGLNRLKGGNQLAADWNDLPEEEQAYLKAAKASSDYEAAVMAANYEQDTYRKTQARFKRDCKGLEVGRLQYSHRKLQQFVSAHRAYFRNETIEVLQTRILSGLDQLDGEGCFDDFVRRTVELNKERGVASPSTAQFEATQYDYQNVFHSLQDAMDITKKLAPHAKLPLMVTTLCNKVRELNGFDTEGIFRKSAMATEVERLKKKLANDDYAIDTTSPHVAACLLKDWLRGLKDSLIPQTHYDMAISMAKGKGGEINGESLEVFLSQLPEVNRETIKYLVAFLKDLIEEKRVAKTRMNLENVAIVFAPTIMKCPGTDAKMLLANSRHEKSFVIALILQLNCTY